MGERRQPLAQQQLDARHHPGLADGQRDASVRRPTWRSVDHADPPGRPHGARPAPAERHGDGSRAAPGPSHRRRPHSCSTSRWSRCDTRPDISCTCSATRSLQASPFDLRALRVTAPPVTLAEQRDAHRWRQAQMSVATNGTVAFAVEAGRSLDRRRSLRGRADRSWPRCATITIRGSLRTAGGSRVDFNSADGQGRVDPRTSPMAR